MSRTSSSLGWIPVALCVLLGAPRLARGDPDAAVPGGHGPGAGRLAGGVPVSGVGSLARLKSEVGDERFQVALKLSRVDARHASNLDTLIVPARGVSLLDLAPFPAFLAETDTIPKLILVSLRVQAFAAYESGTIVNWGPICSGGPRSPTQAGLYHANWKDADHVSSVDSTWIMPWTVNIDQRVGTALHEYSLPGTPVSHCCIRLLETDARWIYGWVDVRRQGREGTPIVLFGAYRFREPPPWKSLPTHPDAASVTAAEIEHALGMLFGRLVPWREDDS